MPGGMVHLDRWSHVPRIHALTRALACWSTLVATALAMRAPLAQDMTEVTSAAAYRRVDSLAAQDPPVLTSRPGLAVQQGGVSVGTRGKLIVAHEAEIARHLRSHYLRTTTLRTRDADAVSSREK